MKSESAYCNYVYPQVRRAIEQKYRKSVSKSYQSQVNHIGIPSNVYKW